MSPRTAVYTMGRWSGWLLLGLLLGGTPADAQTFRYGVLYSFGGTNGIGPRGTPTVLSGRIYGTTHTGGTIGRGVVFAVQPDGTAYTKLHDFLGGADGGFPITEVTADDTGRLWGVTHNESSGEGGTVFSVDPDGGNYLVRHTFEADNFSYGGLCWAGALYGATPYKGAYLNGRIFALTAAGAYTDLFSLPNDLSGTYNMPYSTPLQVNGRLYVMAEAGGTNGVGGLFSLTTNGTDYVKLHDFGGGADGRYPAGSLLWYENRLFGYTSAGGGAGATGSVFSVALDGSDYRLLHSFRGGADDGLSPWAGALVAHGGWLYGLTSRGGSANGGVLYRLRPDGSGFGLAHTFTGSPDGRGPEGGLALYGNHLYGLTRYGGANDGGTLFRIELPGSSPAGLTLLLLQ